MIVVSAAQQSEFMMQISQSIGFWGGLAEVCALIGFTVAVIGGVLRKVNLFSIGCWLLVMIILFVAPLNAKQSNSGTEDPLFFTEITPDRYDWTRDPYETFHLPDEMQQPTEGKEMPQPQHKTPLEDLQKLEPVKKNQAFYMFTPQLVTIDVLNRVRTGVTNSFVDDDGYSAPIVDFSVRNSESLKPLASFSRVMFGNIDDGAYAALLPMLLTFLMVVVIVCTPFILIVAAMMPHWSPGLLLLTLAGVAYTKVVEVMFAMVRGVFGLFLDIGGRAQPGQIRDVVLFNEVLLGLGYLCALGASIWLILKIRKTGQNAHNLLQDFVRESRAASLAQKNAANKISQSSGFALQGSRTLGGMGGGVGTVTQSLSAPLQKLPFDADRHEALRQKATNQKSAEELRPDAGKSDPKLEQENLARAYAKTREQAMKRAKEAGVSDEAALPRAAKNQAGQKNETVEPALSKVAKTLGGGTPDELSQSYNTATQLFTSGALTMRMDDDNTMRIEVNLSLDIMQTLSPELQGAVSHLQNDGHITRATGADKKPFFALVE